MRLPPFAFLAGFSVLAAGCSHPASRAPSSLEADESEALLDDVLSASSPRDRAQTYLDRFLRIQVRSQAWMRETDHAFQGATGPVDLFAQPSYRRLLVARELAEATQVQITGIFRRAHELAGGRGSRAASAKQVVSGVRDALARAEERPAERLLLNRLARDLRETSPDSAIVTVMAPLEGELLHEAAAAVEPTLRAMANALPAHDEITSEVDAIVANLDTDPPKPTPSPTQPPRMPNVYPTAAANGNIDGFTFPHGTWALTFDDGPSPPIVLEDGSVSSITDQDLQNLRAAGIKGTFFWLAKNLQSRRDVVKRVQAAGMAVENHSWSHANMMDPASLARLNTTLEKEIVESTAEDERVYGVKPRFFRLPYGSGFKDPVVRGMIAKLGMVHVRWNVDSLDWNDDNPRSVQQRVEMQMAVNGRGIILFHDIHTAAVTVVPRLLSKFGSRIRWVSIPDIVDELNGKGKDGPVPDNGSPRSPDPRPAPPPVVRPPTLPPPALPKHRPVRKNRPSPPLPPIHGGGS